MRRFRVEKEVTVVGKGYKSFPIQGTFWIA